MKILITGLTGFIGKNFNNYSNYKNDFLAISNKKSINKNNQLKNVNYIDCDIENINNFADEIAKFNPDCVINFAWKGIPDYSEKISNDNVNMTLNFFDFLEKNTKIKKYINAGTCAEYFKPTGKISEDYLVNPESPFSEAKIILSDELKKRCERLEINYINLRLFYVFGLYQRNESLIPHLVNSYKKEIIPKISNPFSKLDFIYVEDVISAIDCCIKNDIPSGSYNVGRGKSITNFEIQKIISQKLNFSFEENLNNKENVGLDFFADINKINLYTGWSPKYEVHEGIQKILEESN